MMLPNWALWTLVALGLVFIAIANPISRIFLACYVFDSGCNLDF